MSLVPTTKDPKKLPEKIAKKRAPASCATIRLLTFHYRKIFTRLLAQVGFGRAPTKIVTEATPGPTANIRRLNIPPSPNFHMAFWPHWGMIAS